MKRLSVFRKSLVGIALLVSCMLLAIMTSYTTILPLKSWSSSELKSGLAEKRFVYEEYAKVLQQFVDEAGRIDYPGLKFNDRALQKFYSRLAAMSPDSHPDLFPKDNDKLAYWINAYNATVLVAILNYYPVDSVLDVKSPAWLFFLPDKAGFFLWQRMRYGGSKTSLYALENDVIRERWSDPRIHFALNCGSAGCPQLPREPFLPDSLDIQLAREARKFINETRNVSIDHAKQQIRLSEIFDWYETDFTDWLKANYPESPATITSYLKIYLKPEKREALEAVENSYLVVFKPYDWSLNSLLNLQ